MKLVSATLRNYRTHRDTTVKFDGQPLLVTGPNESGKSTLVEAIHRALFLKGKITGSSDLLKNMRSTAHPGDPQVIVEFIDSTGSLCRIEKTFGKNATTLHMAGRTPLTGDDAEAELARRLGAGETITAMGGETRLGKRWAHLWVQQGAAGSAPFESAQEAAQSLFSRLQTMGGAALQASAEDARLATAFSEKADEIWTVAGKPVAGSPLARAQATAEQATTALASATTRLQALTNAVAGHLAATKMIQDTETALLQTTEEFKQTKTQADEAETLRQAIALNSQKADPLRNDLKRLEEAGKKIQKQVGLLTEEEQTAGKLQPAMEQAKAKADAAQKELTQAKGKHAQARTAAEAARTAEANLSAARELAQSITALKDAQDAVDASDELRTKLQEAQSRHDALPPVTPAKLKSLQEAQDAVLRTEAALAAMGAKIRVVVGAGTTVTVDGTPLDESQERILTEDADLFVGGAHLRISPGGAGGLTEARANAKTAGQALAAALTAWGVTEVAGAIALLEKKNALHADCKTLKTTLERCDPDALEEKRAKARARHLAAVRKAESLGITQATATDDDAWAQASEQRTRTERDEKIIAHQLAGVEETLTQLKDEEATLSGQITEARNKAASAQAVLTSLLETHGDAATQQARATGLQEKLDAIEATLKAAADKLETLDPENLARRLARLTKSRETGDATINTARIELALAADKLKSDGSSDPYAAEKTATEEAARAHARLADARLHADALKLLAALFTQEKTAAAEQGVLPLAEAANRYIRCVLGPGSAFTLKVDGTGAISQANLDRRGQPTFTFDQLSGGAKEQVGVALRLAMTEILAQGHGGTLPVVLDDAFVNSDPIRVKQIRDMLDLAAERGLQPIVLSCHGEQYTGMGWGTHTLTPTAPTMVGASAPADAGEDDEENGAPVSAAAGNIEGRILGILAREGGLVSTRALREEIDCDKAEFDAARAALETAGKVVAEGRSLKAIA